MLLKILDNAVPYNQKILSVRIIYHCKIVIPINKLNFLSISIITKSKHSNKAITNNKQFKNSTEFQTLFS